MSIDSSIVPVMPMTPPDGELLYTSPYIGGKTTIDEYGNVQITHGYLRADWDSSYSKTYKASGVLTDCITKPTGWDGVHDSVQGLVYGSSSPLNYNVIDSTAEPQWPKVEGVHINDIGNSTDTPTEPSDLKNTKSNIRKIKPDINSDLKRV